MALDEQARLEENNIAFILKKISHAIYNKHNAVLKEDGITFQQLMIIRFLYHHADEDITVKKLEQFLDLKGSSVTSLVKNLVKKGLVEKKQSTIDGRYFNLSLTQKAKDMTEKGKQKFITINEMFSSGLSNDEKKQLIFLLKKLLSSIENMEYERDNKYVQNLETP